MSRSLAISTLEVTRPVSPAGASPFQIPHLPELAHVPRRIDAEDEGELRKFLAEPHIASIRGSSGFGGQLERASSLGFGPVPCRRCGGTWRTVRRRGGKEVVVDWQNGTGVAPRDRFGKQVTYTAALAAYRQTEKQRLSIVLGTRSTPPPGATWTADQAWEALRAAEEAQGRYLLTEDEFRGLFPTLPELDPLTGAKLAIPCGVCAGLGVVPRRQSKRKDIDVTVWPKGSSVDPGEADSDSRVSIWGAHEYLAVGIALADVAALSPLARAALEAYYRPRDTDVITARGSRLPGVRNQTNGWDALNELTPAEQEPKDERGDLKEWQSRRAAQAADLYTFACSCWNLVAYGARTDLDPAEPECFGDDPELESGTHRIDAATYLRLTAAEEPATEAAP